MNDRGSKIIRVGPTRRGSTTHGQWPSVTRENTFFGVSDDPDVLQLWAYSDALSYVPGDTVRFHVSTNAATWDVTILRDGAESLEVHASGGHTGAFHETPGDCSVRGCGWPVAFEVRIGVDWESGGYLARFRAAAPDGAELCHDHIFIVRPVAGTGAERLLLVAATSTWIAYNDWGGSNHYEGIEGPGRDEFSPELSIHRPWSRGLAWLPVGAPRITQPEAPVQGAIVRYPHAEWAYATGYTKKYASAGWAYYERRFVRWAETCGYGVDIISQHDLHERPDIFDGRRCVVFVGHDEYWSWNMRDTLDAFIERGGRVARFAGNFLWQIRLKDSGSRQICYKYVARECDPLYGAANQHLTTNAWEASEVGRPGVWTFGINGTAGVYANLGLCVPRGARGFTVYRPEHWAMEGTDLYYGDLLGAASRVFGYEVDGLDYTFRHGLPRPTGEDGAPDDLTIIAMGPATLIEEDHGHEGSDLYIADLDAIAVAKILHGEATPETIDLVRRGSGMIVSMPKGSGEVFTAAATEWVCGLDERDPFVERVTCNVLDRFLA